MPDFRKNHGKIFEVVYTEKEKEALRESIQKQVRVEVLKSMKNAEMDTESSVLWMLHEQFGFGKDRLRKAWMMMYQRNKDWEEKYLLDKGDGAWVCRRELKKIGVDIEEWYREEGELP